MSQFKMGPRKNVKGESSSSATDYQTKRARNNEAVKRSREKSRQKASATTDRVTELKKENEALEEKIKLLSKELSFLKDIFMAHAGSKHGLCLDDLDIKSLLKDDPNNTEQEILGLTDQTNVNVPMNTS